MTRKIALVAVLFLSVVLVLALFAWHPNRKPLQGASPSTASGSDFTVNTAKGVLSLHELRGKVVLLYFGYTSCPDVCPTTLADMGQALRRLSPVELKRVQGVFVSVDPARDTVERLAKYTGFFHPDIIGATSTPEKVAAIAASYGVAFRKVPGDSPKDYTIDHSSFVTVIDRQGKIYKRLPHGTTPQQMAEVIKGLLHG